MEKRRKLIVTFGLMVFLVIGLYFFTDWFSRVTGYVIGEEEEVALAQCLTEKKVNLYGAESCPDCKIQKGMFNEGFRFIRYIECDGSTKYRCRDLVGVPAWEIDGKIYYGLRTMEELKELSGCEV